MSQTVTYCTQKILHTIKLLFIIGGVEWKNKHGYAIIDRFCERYLVYALEMLPPPLPLDDSTSEVQKSRLKS